MIEVTARLVIMATDDAEADEVLQDVMAFSSRYPALPIVRVLEERREVYEP